MTMKENKEGGMSPRRNVGGWAARRAHTYEDECNYVSKGVRDFFTGTSNRPDIGDPNHKAVSGL